MAARTPTIPEWIPPLPPADDLNSQPSTSEVVKMIAGDGTTIPIAYGLVQIGGRVFAAHYDEDARRWTVGVFYCWGEIEAVDALWLNGEAPAASVTATHYTGTTTQTVDPTLSSLLGYTDAHVVTNEHGTLGIAYSVVQWSEDDYNGFPEITAEIDGRKVYDSREGGHLEGDPSTWERSDTPALHLRDFITEPFFGTGDDVLDSSFETVANSNETNVSTEPRRQLGLVLTTRQRFETWLSIFSSYCSAWIYKRGSQFVLADDRPRAADWTFDASDIVAGSLEFAIAPADSIPTQVVVQYTDKTENIWRTREASAELAGVSSGTVPRRGSELKFPGVGRYSQAKREAQERLDKLQRDLQIEFTLFDDAIGIEIGDVVDLTHPVGFTNELMRVIDVPAMGRVGRPAVRCVAFDTGDYDDSEATAPTLDNVGRFAGNVNKPDDLALRGELVANFDFEVDVDGWTPVDSGLEYEWTDADVDMITFDETDAHSGNQALLVSWKNLVTDPGVRNVRQIQCCPEDGIIVGVFVKGEGTPDANSQPYVGIRKFEADGTFVEQVEAYAVEDGSVVGQSWKDNAWRHIVFVGGCGTVDDDDVAYVTVHCAVNFQNGASGHAFRFDGFGARLLEDASQAPGLAVNPDFYQGSYGWDLGSGGIGGDMSIISTFSGELHNEPYYAKYTHTTAHSAEVASQNLKEFSALPGDTYAVSGLVRSDKSGTTQSTGDVGWRIAWLDSAGSVLSYTEANLVLDSDVGGTFNAYTRVHQVGTAPASTVAGRLEIYSRHDGNGNHQFAQRWIAGNLRKTDSLEESGAAQNPVPTDELAQNAAGQVGYSGGNQTVTSSYATFGDEFQIDTTGADATACELLVLTHTGDAIKTAQIQVIIEESTNGGSSWSTAASLFNAVLPQNWTPYPVSISPPVDEADVRYRVRARRNTGSDQTLEIRTGWILNKA